MAIVIGDIHGDIEKARAFLAYAPEKEHVALGDLVDAVKSGITLKDEIACLDLLLASNAVLLWGNHDLAYTQELPWHHMSGHLTTFEEDEYYAGCSKYLRDMLNKNGKIHVRDIFTDRFLPHVDRMKAAYAVDGWLCTHAGVSPGVADIIPVEVIAADAPEIATWLNEEFKREFLAQRPPDVYGRPQRYGYGPLFQIDIARFGWDDFGGIFWFDPKREETPPSSLVGRQIFGHTQVPYPEIGAYWVNLNSNKDGIWVYDTELNCLVDIGDKV